MSADNISDFLIESGARLFSAIEKINSITHFLLIFSIAESL